MRRATIFAALLLTLLAFAWTAPSASIRAGLEPFGQLRTGLVEGASLAQGGYALSWYTVDGGGATFSTGSSYTLGATIGQPDVGTLSGGSYTLAGGFWPGVESPTPTGPTPLIVNTTDDSSDGACNAAHCSLREAINAANARAGPDTIAFNIPGSDPGCDASGVCTIQPASLLPLLTDDGTTIDGYTQPGASAGADPVLKIVLDGYDNGSFSGLAIRSADNVIRGLVIQRFTPFTAIDISGTAARDNRVEGNFIGTDVSGTQPRGNCTPPVSCAAVKIDLEAQGNTIGPDNLIAFNGQGVWVVDAGTWSNTITRNRIHGNTGKGIWLYLGGNDELSPPMITTASATWVLGTACPNCTIEVFSDAEDEGAVYEGTTTADAAGNWTFTKPGGLTGPNVTATATDENDNTSEFSAPVSVGVTRLLYLPLVVKND